MAKTRTDITVPPLDESYVVVQHFGPLDRYDPAAWHLIYGYEALDLPPDVAAFHTQNYLYQALLEALQWSRMPQLVADICSYCRAGANGPHLPRWNIYRGPDVANAPPCIFWSYWWGPPPWPPT